MKYDFRIIPTGIIVVILAAALAVSNSIKGEETARVHALDTAAEAITWTHLSTENGDLDPPSGSLEQTASLVLDINKDGFNDFAIGTRKSPGPSLVWYERKATGWTRHVIESDVLRIEAGGAYYDIDNDGDLDIVMGDDASGNEVWWWENPYPDYSSDWTRRLIKNSGGDKHHDQMFGDFDDDGKTELVFWNQEDKKLILAEIPSDPRNSGTWNLRTIYSWTSPSHEGLAQADIDNDGVIDIVGGGRWFKLESGGDFTANVIASGMETTRAAAGQLVKGGRPEVVFVPGETSGPLIWYEWDGSSWKGTQLAANVDHGHSLQIEDIDKDGNLDIFAAEMRVNSNNPDAKMWVFFGDGNGNFTTTEIASGYGNHESRVADLDGDGDIDVLGKPYNWDTPRVDIWLSNLNGASCEPSLDEWQRHVIDGGRPERAIFVLPGDLNGDGLADIVSGAWWYQNPGSPSGSWQRKTIGSPLNNVAAVYDFDKDGDLDIVGTEGVGSAGNDHFVWARNNGSGNFTILSNIETADGDFLQGVAVDEFVPRDTEVALSWHKEDKGVQVLDVPSDPSSSTWSWRQISPTSQDEGLSSGDIDRDGDKDLLLGTKWLRNDAQSAASSDWAVAARPYRILTTIDMNGYARSDAPADVALNFTDLLSAAGNSSAFDPNSIQVVEVDGSSNVLDNNVPFQFDAAANYEATTNAAGTLIIMLQGQSAQNDSRFFHIYFDALNGQAATPANVTSQVLFSDNVTDEGQPSYKIETNSATYYFHKDGGGFSSLVDSSGNDWINHNSADGSAGDYRGIPNLVHPNDGGYFHPGRSGLISTLLSEGPLKATFNTRTPDNNWETMWEIYPDHARLTVLKADTNYWFLYEGTPGGQLELNSDFVVRSDGTQTDLSQAWAGDIAAPEWAYFSDPDENRSLFLVNEEDDSLVDSYTEMNGEMTVFGFGRENNSRYLSQVPSTFTLGFSDGTDPSSVETALNSVYRPLSITLGSTEQPTATADSGPWTVYDLFNTSDSPDRNRLADMNEDGRLDAVVGYEAISKEGTLAWYEQPRDATALWTEHVIANNVIGPQSLDVADMDGDGDIDVVVGEHDLSSDAAPRMLVYEHPGSETGTWTRHVVYTGDEHHDGAQLVDIDNDGDLDIISIGWSHDDVLLYENLSCSGGSQPQPTATNTPVPGPTNTPTATPVPGPIIFGIYISSSSGGIVNGVSYNDEDILIYDPETNEWSLFLDGSDVGLSGSSTLDIDAFHVFDDNRILFSVAGASSIPDVGAVDDSDLILFTPTSLGTNSAGHFSLYFDGSDVDLSTDNEDIDAIAILENGDLVISTLGAWTVGSLSGEDEDLIKFAPINLGDNTSGTWSLYFDGSDVGLDTNGDEDVWGAGVDGSSGAIYLTVKGIFSVSGVSGDGSDVFKCQSSSLGDTTICAFDLVLDGSTNGLGGDTLDGLALRGLPGSNDGPDNTPTPTPTPTDSPVPDPTSTPAPTNTSQPPTATNTPVPGACPADPNNVLNNPGFENGTSGWSSYFANGVGSFATGSPAFECEQAARVAFSGSSSNMQLFQTGFTLRPNTNYVLSFAGYSNTGHDLSVFLHKHTSPYTSYGISNAPVNLTSDWQTFTMPFTTGSEVTNPRLRFWFVGNAAAGDVYWLDDVRIVQAGG